MSIIQLRKATAPQGTMLETGVHNFWSLPCPSAMPSSLLPLPTWFYSHSENCLASFLPSLGSAQMEMKQEVWLEWQGNHPTSYTGFPIPVQHRPLKCAHRRRVTYLVLFRLFHSAVSIQQAPSYPSSGRFTCINLFGFQDSLIYY